MHVTNLSLCQELHELSGWDDCGLAYKPYTPEIGKYYDETHHVIWNSRGVLTMPKAYPAYDAGYLLAKFDGSTDINIPKERLQDSADYLADLHIRHLKAEWRKIDSLPYEVSSLGDARHETTKPQSGSKGDKV